MIKEEGPPLAQAMRAMKPVRTLPDLLARCEVCEDTGCWEWLGCMSNKGKTPSVRLGGNSAKNARGVARLLSGKKLLKGYRTIAGKDCSDRCINPAHTRHVSPSAFMREKVMPNGKQSLSHLAALTAASRKRSSSLIRSVEQGDEIRRRLAAGELAKNLAVEFKCSPQNICYVGKGVLWAAAAVRGSSVFAWGGA